MEERPVGEGGGNFVEIGMEKEYSFWYRPGGRNYRSGDSLKPEDLADPPAAGTAKNSVLRFSQSMF